MCVSAVNLQVTLPKQSEHESWEFCKYHMVFSEVKLNHHLTLTERLHSMTGTEETVSYLQSEQVSFAKLYFQTYRISIIHNDTV